MTEITLYRKYRPQKFKDVIGQDHIVKVLESSVKLGKISHAYLFSGSRGTGKTSIARIMARELGVSDNDLYEIDAASNTGVDDVRALNESVNTLPFESPYKAYILDEVHMLSKSAFNALLKTLEEPPKHVIFMLATTEFDKLPETVVSRCQSFSFKKPTQQTLKEVALNVAKKEGYSIESSSAELVAILGDGSFRDTLGILQKVISLSKDKKISAEEVETVTGTPRSSVVNGLVSAIGKKDLAGGLKVVESASKQGIDMAIFIKLLLFKLRTILLLKFSPDMEGEIKMEVSDTDFQFLSDLSRQKDLNIGSQTVIEILNAEYQTARSAIPELPLELALVKLLSS